MRNIALIAVLTLLAGCATERYYPVHLEGGGHYIAERERPAAAYDSLWAVGVYPWWVHSFYTPYFYPYTFSYYHPFYYPYYGPYHFAGWYSSWPYYAGFPGGYQIGNPPYGAHLRHPAGPGAVAPRPGNPGHVAPALPLRPQQAADRQLHANRARSAVGEDLYNRPSPPGAAPSFGRSPAAPVSAPVMPAAASRPFGSEPGLMHRPPAERTRSERHE